MACLEWASDPLERLTAFVKKLDADYPMNSGDYAPRPLRNTEWGWVSVVPHAGTLFIAEIYVLPSYRRKGNATRMFRYLCSLADATGVPMQLDASPFGDRGIPLDDLVEFYNSYGFVELPTEDTRVVTMRRRCQPTAIAAPAKIEIDCTP